MAQRSSACHAAITQAVSDGILNRRQSMTMGRHSNGKALRFQVKSAGWGVGLSQGCVGCMVSLLILPIGGWLAAFADLWLIGMALCTSVVAHVDCPHCGAPIGPLGYPPAWMKPLWPWRGGFTVRCPQCRRAVELPADVPPPPGGDRPG